MAVQRITANNSVVLSACDKPDGFTGIRVDEDNYHLEEKDNQNYRITPLFIEIHPLRSYRLSWEYKCSSDCKFYQAVICYNNDRHPIHSYDILRRGNPVIVKRLCNDNKTLIVEGDLSGWNRVNAQCSTRIIGFYFSADDFYERVSADAYIKYEGDWRSTEKNSGAYCHLDAHAQRRTIRLSREIPQDIAAKIVPGQTIIRNHQAGSTYLYSFYIDDSNARAVIVDNEWQHSEYQIDGNLNSFCLEENKFRKGTKYVKIGMVCHKGSVSFNHVTMEQV